ncbi:MAG: hypothetical protein AB7N91_09105 [Candidatus Tectimicrobiota bacterium]
MFVTRGDSEWEITLRAVDEEWEGKIVEYALHRPVPVVHLCHNWTSSAAALAGVRRRWQRLFPEDSADDLPDFQQAISEEV